VGRGDELCWFVKGSRTRGMRSKPERAKPGKRSKRLTRSPSRRPGENVSTGSANHGKKRQPRLRGKKGEEAEAEKRKERKKSSARRAEGSSSRSKLVTSRLWNTSVRGRTLASSRRERGKDVSREDTNGLQNLETTRTGGAQKGVKKG